MPRPQSPLTQYILTLAKTLTAKEVVAKVAARGFTTTEKNVHRVRQLAKSAAPKSGKKAGKAAKTTVATAKPKAGSKAATKSSAGRGTSGKGGGSKSDFVRSFSLETPAKEIVATAKAKGIIIGIPYVYAVRTGDKVRAHKSGGAKTSKHAKASVAPSTSGKGAKTKALNAKLEAAFRAAAVRNIVEYGVKRTRALFEQVASSK